MPRSTPTTTPPAESAWLTRDLVPWLWRRLSGRTAGDGRSAKHDDYIVLAGRTSASRTISR